MKRLLLPAYQYTTCVAVFSSASYGFYKGVEEGLRKWETDTFVDRTFRVAAFTIIFGSAGLAWPIAAPLYACKSLKEVVSP